MTQESQLEAADIIRRFMVLFYDGLLIIAVIFIAFLLTIPFTPDIDSGQATQISEQIVTNSDNGTENAATGKPQQVNYFLTAYLFCVVFAFFGWFWTHGGQTLGMRTWKLKMVSMTSSQVSWKQALVRFLVSLPVWISLFVIIAFSSGKVAKPVWLTSTPDWLLFLIVSAWLVFDQMPDNWRDKVSRVRIVMTR